MPEFAWRDRSNARTASARIFSVPARIVSVPARIVSVPATIVNVPDDIPTEDILNTNLDSYHHTSRFDRNIRRKTLRAEDITQKTGEAYPMNIGTT
jgi:hypothetical protein